MEWWKRKGPKDWKELVDREEVQTDSVLRASTYAGKPFGEELRERNGGTIWSLLESRKT
jgi:hypothetical protein